MRRNADSTADFTPEPAVIHPHESTLVSNVVEPDSLRT
jgi:hypothetical protein